MQMAKATPKLYTVLSGETVVQAVEGGFARKPVPEDSLVVETAETTVVIPWTRIYVESGEFGFASGERDRFRSILAPIPKPTKKPKKSKKL